MDKIIERANDRAPSAADIVGKVIGFAAALLDLGFGLLLIGLALVTAVNAALGLFGLDFIDAASFGPLVLLALSYLLLRQWIADQDKNLAEARIRKLAAGRLP